MRDGTRPLAVMALAMLALGLTASIAACERRPLTSATALDAGAPPTSGASSAVEPAPTSWAEHVRRERYAEAAIALDALAEVERAKPEIRYLRARVAVELGDGAAALRMLEGLESALPLLAQDVLDRRADAAFAAARFNEAGDYWSSRASASSQLKASRAFERALDAVRARSSSDRVVADPKASRLQEAEARARRLRLGARTPREEAEDARWLAVEGADLAESEGAEARLAAIDAAHPLTPVEVLKRARLLGEAGKVEAAVKLIESIKVPATSQARIDRLRAKAEVFYRSRQHPLLAARTFDEVVKLAGPTAVEDSFKAARALSRGDHDDEAIERFVTLARRTRDSKSPFAEEALFLAGRLHLLHARFVQAAALLDDHHAKHGTTRKEAARMRALAHLMAGHHAQAIRLFEELSDDEREPLASARARTMAAYAAMKNGDRTLAVARWSEVVRARPLSWPAMVARARLSELKAPVPPTFETPPEPPAEPLAVNLPPPVDLLHRLGLDDEAETALREREPAVTAMAPGRSTEALCVAYGKLGRSKRQYQIAQQIPQALLFAPPMGRARWSWECAYPAPYEGDVRDEELRSRLAPGLVHAVMRQESGFDPSAVSPARARGLLQLMPDTARTVAAELAPPLTAPFDVSRLDDPGLNVRLGATYLRDLIERFRGSVPLALAGYNGGPDNVTKWMGRLKGVPLDIFLEHVPFSETRGYVVRVMGNLARYAYLRGGDDAVPAITLAPVDASP